MPDADALIILTIARLEDEIEDLRRRQCLPALAHIVASKLRQIEGLRAILQGAACP
jgi:hypothetical protein